MARINKRGNLVGRMGDVYLRDYNGKSVSAAMPSTYRDANSPTQQTQRAKLLNVMAMYRVLKPILKDAFENKVPGQRDYDCFKSNNLVHTPTIINKQAYTEGGCLLGNYVISEGTLPEIVCQQENGSLTTNVPSMPDGKFWKEGDVLRVVKCVQMEDENGTPIVKVLTSEMTLTSMGFEELPDVVVPQQNRLAISDAQSGEAYGFIHLRQMDDRVHVSSQTLQVVD